MDQLVFLSRARLVADLCVCDSTVGISVSDWNFLPLEKSNMESEWNDTSIKLGVFIPLFQFRSRACLPCRAAPSTCRATPPPTRETASSSCCGSRTTLPSPFTRK